MEIEKEILEDKMQKVERRVRVLKKQADELYNLVVKEAVLDGNVLKCPKCNHPWETRSKALLVSCSSCGNKVKNTYAQNEKGKILP